MKNSFSQTQAAGLREHVVNAIELGQYETARRSILPMARADTGTDYDRYLLARACLELGHWQEAEELLTPIVRNRPELPEARIELARCWQTVGRAKDALHLLQAASQTFAPSHRFYLVQGDLQAECGDYADALRTFERFRRADLWYSRISEATRLLQSGDHIAAGNQFRLILKERPSHLLALCGLGGASLAAGYGSDAERLLQHARRQSHHFPLVGRGLGNTLLYLNRPGEALRAVATLTQVEPDNPVNWITVGSIHARLLRQHEALLAYHRATQLTPGDVELHLSMGHLYKTLGERKSSESCYQKCLAIQPTYSEAYLSLAELKNYRFSDGEVTAMQSLVDLEGVDQAQLHFALARAFEQRRSYEASFGHYVKANTLRRKRHGFDMESFKRKSERVKKIFNEEFFAGRRGGGYRTFAPIFVVGLPRSGSTLVEQILSSHPVVEGTMELPNILTLVREMDRRRPDQDGYPEVALELNPRDAKLLGERYITEVAQLRSGRARFVDKMPNNFSHIGLIKLILPDAFIVDVRRHPMDSCFSCYKQYFAEGQAFSYDLGDLSHYYRCYLDLMAHWRRVLPGKVFTVSYERLVQNPEPNIRAMLAHCDLEFDTACMTFHRNARPVRTASSEQVRQPLYTTGMGYWKNYAVHLQSLQADLADCLDTYLEGAYDDQRVAQ